MKRRYTILFFLALSPLVGLSWLASTVGFPLWSTRSFGLVGMILAAVIAGVAMVRNANARWPAGVAAVALLPNTVDMLRIVGQVADFVKFLGASLVLIVFGSLAAVVTAIVIAVLPVPPPPREPQVAPARIIE